MPARLGDTERLIAAAIVGKPLHDLARAAGISVSSAQRRLRERDALAATAEVRSQQRVEATGRLAALRNAALDLLALLVEDTDPSIALRAVTTVLGSSARFDQLNDFDLRLAALESPTTEIETSASGGSDVD
jgi:hypothetical protein